MIDIYDCFTFYNELDLLELRLHTLDDIVDYFVLVEGEKTYRGEDKILHYKDNADRFSDFHDKIIHISVSNYPANINNAWEREYFTRNSIKDGLTSCSKDDIVIISDVDEIPRPDVVQKYSEKAGISVLGLRFYYYFFNCRVSDRLFPGTVIGRFDQLPSPQQARDIPMNLINLNMKTKMKFSKYPFQIQSLFTSIYASLKKREYIRVVPDAGWHFSYLSDIDGIIDKIETFSHSEYDSSEYKDPNQIREKMNAGEDIFGRDITMEFIEITDNHPEFLVNNQSHFSDYIF